VGLGPLGGLELFGVTHAEVKLLGHHPPQVGHRDDEVELRQVVGGRPAPPDRFWCAPIPAQKTADTQAKFVA
jgi:hypothetical protein